MKNWRLVAVILVSFSVLSACGQAPRALTADDFSQGKYLKSPVEASSILADSASRAELKILDVRTPAEFQAECIDGSKNIDFESADFDSKIAVLDKSADYFVYCRSGNRSAQAVAKMRDAGFTNIIELGGGINAWKTAGEPVKQNCQ